MSDGSTPGRVAVSVDGAIASVTLTRPEKRNALDEEMFEALVRAGRSLLERDDVKVVVLTGDGASFCAGLDFSRFAAMGSEDYPTTERDLLGASRALGPQAAHVWSLVPVPVIAGLQGHAFGGGLQIALNADIRVSAPDTAFSVMEIQWGLVPDMTGSQLLPALIGRDQATLLTVTGRVFDGREARALGLVTELHDDPRARAHELAREIATHTRESLVESKRLLGLAGRVSLEEGLAQEQVAISRLRGSAAQTELVRARLARRNA
ncbi:crotonase/enoyl-CoA hydratase family protein [Kribbia dieselivorans]|uniref:crotonase/enoyl-CoA hydratase family protein n=1 Tax=Kribbia dieselivorans TaxID=331526 RepID=UPI0008385479|nr:crotonase/enoyl-CoA hydratase family protein [Kribbia dieselivorans]